MLIRAEAKSLKRISWRQFTVRFLFGGAITVLAGLIAKKFGPAIGGLFLAFPAIFPAAATLTQKLEEEKKAERHLSGKMRGILAAGVQASGSVLGSVGLIAFAILFWEYAPTMHLWLLFPLTIITWCGVSAGCWYARKRIHFLHRVKPLAERLPS